MSIHTEYSLFWILPCFLLAALISYLLYRNNPLKLENRFARVVRPALYLLRFLTVFIVCFLLLGVLFQWINNRVEKPTVAILIDNSGSVVYGKDSLRAATAITEQVNRVRNDLASDYEVQTYLFDKTLNHSESPDFKGTQTNPGEALSSLASLYEGKNLGGVVLFSDGIQNSGESPLQTVERSSFPVYPVALGDTVQKKDLILPSARYNKTAFAGNSFTIVADVKALRCKGATVRLTLSHEGMIRGEKTMVLTTANQFIPVNFLLAENKEGTYHYTLQLDPLAGEATLLNNKLDLFIQVIRQKQKVLILASAPHPDVNAFKTVLESSDQFEVTTGLSDAFSTLPAGLNLVILHQIPDVNGRGIQLLKQAKASQIPLLFVLGAQSALSQLPAVTADHFAIRTNRPALNEALPAFQNDFTLFTVNEEEVNTIRKFPPLYAPFGDYRTDGEFYTLFTQQLGNVLSNYPLIGFYNNGLVREGILAGEGFWKWRLADMNLSRQTVSSALLVRMVQYLIEKKDNAPFRITGARRFDESEPVELDAVLYNESNQPVNTPDIVLQITDSRKKNYSFAFSKTGNSYHVDAGVFPPGVYRYSASAQLGSKLHKAAGTFTVAASQLEFAETTADHQLLNELAQTTGGELFFPERVNTLADAIKRNSKIHSVSYREEELLNLIRLKGLFWTLLILLSAEWFIRKWNGTV